LSDGILFYYFSFSAKYPKNGTGIRIIFLEGKTKKKTYLLAVQGLNVPPQCPVLYP